MPSDLPILPDRPTAPPRPKTTAEKYGGLYYLGVAGLIVVVGLLAWFGLGVWSLRAVWRNVYVLHDPERTEAERVEAAYRLSRNPDVTQRQYWDIALRKELPAAGALPDGRVADHRGRRRRPRAATPWPRPGARAGPTGSACWSPGPWPTRRTTGCPFLPTFCSNWIAKPTILSCASGSRTLLVMARAGGRCRGGGPNAR